MQIREGPARRQAPSAAGALRSPMSAMMLAMFATMASFYVAGRLWQDAQNRVYLIKELDRRTGQGQSTISVDDTLKVVACRQQGKRLASLEMELAAAKHEGFVGKYSPETNGTRSGKKPLIVIGIMTSFGRKNYRDAVRKSWLPTGSMLKKLEEEKGIVVRFVVGRSANRGDTFDRDIDDENRSTKDFLILESHSVRERRREMLRRARVPMPAATAARPRRGGPLPKAKEAGALRLFRAGTDAVLYGSLAAVWARDFVSTVVEILGRWVFGKCSTMEAAGIAVRAWCTFIMVLLFPSFLPLVIMRVREHAKLALKEEDMEKLASNHNIMVGSDNEQVPKKSRAAPRFPKGVKVAPLYGLLPIVTFQLLAFMMQLHHEKGSLMWRLADVLFDVARLGYAVIVGVWAVRNAVILVTVPKAKEGDH